jgi:sugar phosphate isomerase/epimerase
MKPPLELGVVSDEISPDFREAVRHGLGWGITRYEIRVLKSGRVPHVDPEEFADVMACARQHGLNITALSPGIFKHPLSKAAALEREMGETLPATLGLARQCGAPLIIVFGFQREAADSPDGEAQVVDYLRRAAALAEQEGIALAIENEPGFWCDSGANTRRIIKAVGSPALGANWDPCNAYGTPEIPYPAGYEAIKDVIVNVHAKDTKKGALIECVPVGEGALDWRGQIRSLLTDRPVAHLTIETHCHPLVESTRKNVETLRRLMREEA